MALGMPNLKLAVWIAAISIIAMVIVWPRIQKFFPPKTPAK